MAQRRRQQRARGTVIAQRSFGESDRIVELLTDTSGRVAALARGGRASRRRFSGALDLFVDLDVQLIATGSLWTLHAADIVTARLGIRASLSRFRRASLICECARILCAEQQPVPDTMKAVSQALDRIDRGEAAEAAAVYGDLLAATGILPDAGVCMSCAATIGPEGGGLARDGRVQCSRCGAGPPLGRRAWQVLAAGQCSDEEVAAWFERWAVELIEAHLGRPLRSRAVLS